MIILNNYFKIFHYLNSANEYRLMIKNKNPAVKLNGIPTFLYLQFFKFLPEYIGEPPRPGRGWTNIPSGPHSMWL
jgi:hypothetical protein